ncbi:hypothetical protein AABB24_012685, partial [Solanum stoloniferum]
IQYTHPYVFFFTRTTQKKPKNSSKPDDPTHVHRILLLLHAKTEIQRANRAANPKISSNYPQNPYPSSLNIDHFVPFPPFCGIQLFSIPFTIPSKIVEEIQFFV